MCAKLGAACSRRRRTRAPSSVALLLPPPLPPLRVSPNCVNEGVTRGNEPRLAITLATPRARAHQSLFSLENIIRGNAHDDSCNERVVMNGRDTQFSHVAQPCELDRLICRLLNRSPASPTHTLPCPRFIAALSFSLPPFAPLAPHRHSRARARARVHTYTRGNSRADKNQ